jgi:hypothetical protein
VTAGTLDQAPPAAPPAPPEAAPDAPPPAPDSAPKRPTTRAGRRALAEAKRAQAKAAPDKSPKAASSKPAPRRASLESRLQGTIASLGTSVMVAGAVAGEAVSADGLLIVQAAPSLAAALDKIAKDNPAVAASLERMLTAGVWSGLIVALLPVLVGIAGNHGLIPPQLLGMLQAQAVEPPADA